MALSESAFAQVWREFSGTECPGCGRTKNPQNGFCKKCYFSLPREMQKALWQRFGSGYEEAHDDARDYIQQERRAKS